MADKQQNRKALTAEEMRGWLAEEIRSLLKENELRIRDATEFVTAYCVGALTSEQAQERLRDYGARWGEPLGGVNASSYRDDDAILEAIDKGRDLLERARTHTEQIGKRGPFPEWRR